ncbi:hypothetical protein ZIOFF_006615 [Zingiber officinale]|uniref:Callose synthase helical domain-containing protein n=1 Tax=Zingiber officinale TaxID=94328 RepID=A0A8J5LP09_ZINOF|nr:hypothetical protein ZIOFF_006615 [Zingiber officinale]
MLRSRFQSMPSAFNACLIPPEKSEASRSSGFRAALSSKFEQIPIALDMAKDSDGKYRELQKRIHADVYMICAVKECYASFMSIIKYLVDGKRESEVVDGIFSKVKDCIENDSLHELKLSHLPVLCNKFIELIKLLMTNKKDDRGQVIILFQDMLEVVTRDIMEEELPG